MHKNNHKMMICYIGDSLRGRLSIITANELNSSRRSLSSPLSRVRPDAGAVSEFRHSSGRVPPAYCSLRAPSAGARLCPSASWRRTSAHERSARRSAL